MSHKHEWRFAPSIEQVSSARTNTDGFYCTISDCDEYILLPEAERRINAAEYLDPIMATIAGNAINGNKNWGGKPIMTSIEEFKLRENLWRYADAREGKQ